MAMTALTIKAGVDVQSTKLESHGTWNTCNCIRFKDSHLQKLGGCQRLTSTPLVGICRGVHAFQDLSGFDYVAAGTDQRLELFNFGSLYDITPIRTTTTPIDPFDTTSGLTTVTVTDAGHGASNGDWMLSSGATAVAGLTLNGYFQISAVTLNTYQITAPARANATTTGGGTPTIKYLIHSDITDGDLPYGAGLYGAGVYGSGSYSPVRTVLRQWSLDNWGQDLVAAPTNGPPYVWIPPIAANNFAALITGTGVPLYVTGLFVAMPQRQVIAYGAEAGGTQDPLLIRWSDVEDYTMWTAAPNNQAGSFRLSSGSRIVGGIQAQQAAMYWTDIEMWSSQYLGYPLVYGFNKVGVGCGLLGMRAVAQIGNTIVWMGQSSFFIWDGSSVKPLPCSVWDIVFDNIDRAYADGIVAAPNSWFNEVFWFFPTTGSMGVPDTYVKVNLTDQTWDYGTLSRTAWMDQSVFGAPIATDSNNLLQQHEVSPDLDGTAMNSWAETGWLDISDGTYAVFMERFLPDFILSSGATILVTVSVVDYVGDTPRVYGPFPVTAQSPYFRPRCRGRFASIKVQSVDLGSFWRQGEMLYVTAPAGRRA